MNFEDHFSKQARDYARYRPGYPDELFAFLASIAPGRDLAWDCGTGNGQAAIGLAQYFQRVIATDASPDQIAQAQRHDRIEYRVEKSEQVSIASGSVDLVTVAVAVHWFDLEDFYQEVRRVLKPGGVLAVWTYHLTSIDPEVDRVVEKYYSQVLAGYWPERFHYLDERYQTLPFPFEELQTPSFSYQADWDLEHFAGFLDSWSGTRRYHEAHGRHPLEEIWPELLKAWGEPTRVRKITWPLFLCVGKANGTPPAQ
jgi:SAM-dependent methyltransferase